MVLVLRIRLVRSTPMAMRERIVVRMGTVTASRHVCKYVRRYAYMQMARSNWAR